MNSISLDDFIDAFSAKLVSRGENRLRLNDPTVRDALFRVYRFLDERVSSDEAKKDKPLKRSLVNLRNVFQPSAIGSFDRLESLLRAKQLYLTDHPNPFYNDVVIRIASNSAKEMADGFKGTTSDLVSQSVDRYLSAS